MKRLNTEMFVKRVQDLVGNEYSVLGEYINSATKIEMKHNKCGHEYSVRPNTFFNGSRCPQCFKSIPYTTEKFKEKIYGIVGNKYSLIGEYINSSTKVKLRHNICGYEYEVFPQNFLRGNRCPICSYQLKRSLPEEIVAYFVSKYFSIIQSYRSEWLTFETCQKSEIDIWIPKLKIGIEYDGNIHKSDKRYENDLYKNNIIQQSSECNTLIRLREQKTHTMNEIYSKIVIIKANKSIAVTSKKGLDELEKMIQQLLNILGIKNIDIKITDEIISKCQNRVEDYYIELGKPIRSKKIKTRANNTDGFKKRVYELVKDDYIVLGEYINSLEKIQMKHTKCGYEYPVRPNDFFNGRRCPNCSKRKRYSTETYKKKIEEMVGIEYSLLNEYVNSRTYVIMRHNKCGYEYPVKPNAFNNGRRCPKCSRNNRE